MQQFYQSNHKHDITSHSKNTKSLLLKIFWMKGSAKKQDQSTAPVCYSTRVAIKITKAEQIIHTGYYLQN